MNKKVLVYGTGNLAFKIALRLSEKNAEVYIAGRNSEKVIKIVELINQITNGCSVAVFKGQSQLDGMISFVSANEAVNAQFLSYFKKEAVFIDGGIGNFSKELIKQAAHDKHLVVRLDVRVADSILEGKYRAINNSFFEDVMGTAKVDDINLVSGGIIGDKGTVIVDKIKNPTKIIGIANGIGGLINVSEYNIEEKNKLEKVKGNILSHI